MAHLYIIRGVPGSGKTTFAKELKTHGVISAYFEADQYMVDSEGYYKFNPNLLSKCHDLCYDMVKYTLRDSRRSVAVSNTFTRKWEYQRYIDLGFPTTIIVMQGNYQNIHGVPDDIVKEMKDRFEYER